MGKILLRGKGCRDTSCICLTLVHALLFQHQCLFLLGSLLVNVAQVLPRPAPGLVSMEGQMAQAQRERVFRASA